VKFNKEPTKTQRHYCWLWQWDAGSAPSENSLPSPKWLPRATSFLDYSCKAAKKVAGQEYLEGDPVTISIFWDEKGQWVERTYDDFVQERRESGSAGEAKPWTPHWVFHGSGVIHNERTGCIACPCDCPGGIIADNRTPIYKPMPTVRFDWSKAPPAGTAVYVRIRPVRSQIVPATGGS
jgi:hypothetical protein